MTLHARRAAATTLALTALFGLSTAAASTAQAAELTFRGVGLTLSQANQRADIAATEANIDPEQCDNVSGRTSDGRWVVILTCEL
ncbi:hypothetical protein GCM10009665_05510 [Kitasatospora nipponensis]|uniref:Uncharacterized protein n=1 Tax=Kitasatospora nipponensis TaxID=258049 RepID=A0ABP4G9W4_9ACTN